MRTDVKSPFTIGIDLGGTKMEAAIVDQRGQPLLSRRFSTDHEQGADGVVSGIISAVEGLNKESEEPVGAVGIGVAGQIDRAGVVRSAPNLPFTDERLQAKLEAELGIPTVVTNDVRAATYGEWKYGAGRGVDDLVVIFVGTGIGGGVVSGGRLLEGCTNTFGEIGHITLVADGRKCRCPNYGCLEAYAGGWAIAERAQEAVSKDPKKGGLIKSIAGGEDNITAEDVSRAFREGDPLVKRIIEDTGRYLGAGLVGVVNAFNPCLLILGGGVIEGLPELVLQVEGMIKEFALRPNLGGLKVGKTFLGGRAGVVGAAALAREKVGGEI